MLERAIGRYCQRITTPKPISVTFDAGAAGHAPPPPPVVWRGCGLPLPSWCGVVRSSGLGLLAVAAPPPPVTWSVTPCVFG